MTTSIFRRPWQALVNFHRDDCLHHCASVAFYSLLSLGPLIYLAGATLQLFPHGGDGLQVWIERICAFLPEAAAGAVRRVAPALRTHQGLVVLALPVLIWVATIALSALEHAVNVTFGTTKLGKPWHPPLKAVAILGLGWSVLGLSLLLNMLIALLDRYRSFFDLSRVPGRVVSLVSYLSLLAASYLAFLLFYKLLPRTRVRWRAAAAGALIAVVLWEGARRLFGGILLISPTFGLLSGTLAGIVAFLLWIYTAVAIVLLGSEWAALLNGSRGDVPPEVSSA